MQTLAPFPGSAPTMQAPSALGGWQSEHDGPLRQQLTDQIYAIFDKRKNGAQSQRLPDFVKRLEQALYKASRTKEEYMDPSSLELRLQEVARQFVNVKQNGAAAGTSSATSRPSMQMGGQPGATMQAMGQVPMGMVPNAGPLAGSGFVPTPPDGLAGAHEPPAQMQMGQAAFRGGNAAPSPVMPSDMGPGMVPNPGLGGGSMLMPNGAPIMIKGQGGSGFPTGPYMHGSGMVPNTSMVPNTGMVPNTSMVPNTGMVPNSGMVPTHGGMGGPMGVPQPGPMPPGPNGFVPTSSTGLVPNGAMGGGSQSASLSTSGLGAPGPLPTGGIGSMGTDKSSVTKQQRWLLFLRHCAKCKQSDQECSLKAQCKFGKQLWQHVLNCANQQCEFPRCTNSKELLKHHHKCQDARCAICVPVKEYVKRTRAAQVMEQQGPGMPGQVAGMPGPHMQMPHGMVPNPGMPPPMHMQQQQAAAQAQQRQFQQQQQQQQQMAGMVPIPPVPPLASASLKRPYDGYGGFSGGGPMMQGGAGAGFAGGLVPNMQGPDDQASKRIRADKSILTKNTGTSLLETFAANQLIVHTETIKAASAAARAQLPPPANPGDDCLVCGLTRLTFEPPVIYCMTCGLKIKRSQTFYSTPEANTSDIKGSWCHTCYTDMKPDRILLEGSNYKKGDLAKKKNDNEEEEGWVQCDSCEGWVHMICGMFNKGRNNQDVHFLCPDCLLTGLTTGVRKAIEVRPQSMLDANELPKTNLSNYLELFMMKAIEHERRERASLKGVDPHQVPGCEGLSVRVINNVMKKVETKPKYVETFHASEGYPTEFPYRQRVIVLFQNIEGVDVCLFVMYVQEYGPNCPKPNQNCVYLSYLDSVKYFRPDGVMAVGCPNPNTSLRTFVYHMLQVAYLSYVKKLGFEQMYIWACPPMQGDDYILYCHPSKQKTPRSDRLRAWYHDMLKDAKNRGIVVHLSTLWDSYFEGGKDHRMERCSSTHIPYLEGDYWPGEAENLLGLIADGGSTKGAKSKEASLAAAGAGRKNNSKGKRYGSGPATTDEQLMSRLGEILGGNMKEDFIVVHLKEVCTFCRTHVDSGIMYKYQSAAPLKSQGGRTFEGVKIEGGPNVPTGNINSISICESCFHDEQRRFMERGAQIRLPMGVTPDKLQPIKLESDMGHRIVDVDPDMECEHFETRQSFLNLCQGNHYQFDTIRRAKHSSMMVLYHLHNPDAPAFTTTCNVCNQEIESGTGFRCTVCTDFDICASCQQHAPHQHPLTRHVRRVDETRMRLTEQERKERNEQLQRTMALLVHACSCNNPACSSNSCRKVRQLFQHAMGCQVKVTGGCQMCKKMWCLLNLHAKSCTQPDCPVPRCRELKELRRRQASRQEDQRRKAYQMMLRNQMASQVAGQ